MIFVIFPKYPIKNKVSYEVSKDSIRDLETCVSHVWVSRTKDAGSRGFRTGIERFWPSRHPRSSGHSQSGRINSIFKIKFIFHEKSLRKLRLWIRVLLLYLRAVAAPSGWIFNKIYFPAKIEKIELPTWPLPALRFRPVEMTYIYKIKFSLSEIFKENNSPAGGGTTLVLSWYYFYQKTVCRGWNVIIFAFAHLHWGKHCHSIKVSIVTRTFLLGIFCIKVLLSQTNTKYFCTLFDWIHRSQNRLMSHSKTHSSCHVVFIFYGNLLGKSMTFWKYRMDADAELHNVDTFYRSSSVLELFSTEPIKFLRHSVFS